MRQQLFASSPVHRTRLRVAVRAGAAAFAAECQAIAAMVDQAAPSEREFVAGEVACELHLAPAAAATRIATALAVAAHPRLLSALTSGRIGVGHALALADEVQHLDPPHAAAVLAAVLDGGTDDGEGSDDRTAGELRSAAKKAVLVHDPALARRRHEAARRQAGVRGRPLPDGMARLTIDCTAVEMAQALAAIDGRVAQMPPQDDEMTSGQRRVAAVLHALGCERTLVQAVIECPVDRAVDLHALSGAAVWSVDIRMPVAVALGLSDHPALLAGYGPIGADEARALLPTAELVRACVDSATGEVLAVDPPVRPKAWQAVGGDRATALRAALTRMATAGGSVVEAPTDGYVPSRALGRLVDLRDVTSVFPGDATSARRSERDHRLPYPLGPTSPDNLQALSQHWHRAKHEGGWSCTRRTDGAIRWRSPTGGVYVRRPKWEPPPELPPAASLPPLA